MSNFNFKKTLSVITMITGILNNISEATNVFEK